MTVDIRLKMERLQVLADSGRTLQQLIDVTKQAQRELYVGFDEVFVMSWVVLYNDVCYVVEVTEIYNGYHVSVFEEDDERKLRYMDLDSGDLNEFVAKLKELIDVR